MYTSLGELGREEVHRAAKVLDRIKPGWANKVNTETLDLRSIHSCLLIQLFAPAESRWYKPWTWFNIPSSGYEEGLRLLKEAGYTQQWAVFASREHEPAWLAEIEARRLERQHP